jgi:AcrR family transcriptional regulator
MPGRRGRPAADRAKVRIELARQVLNAAEEAILTARFADLSIDQLTRQAGISRSKFYVYFQDKDDLVQAWFADVWNQVHHAQADWWALNADSTRDDLRRALDRIVRTYRPHATLMAAVHDQALHNPAIRDQVDQVIAGNVAGLAEHIRTGQRRGFVDPGLLPTETAAWLTWMAERTQHALDPTIGEHDLDRHTDTYTDIVWQTLYAPARAMT